MANSQRRRNTLLDISINGKRLVQDTKIKEGLVDAFQNLLSAPNSWRPPLPDLPFNVIGDEQAAKLEEMFTEEEILATISGLSGDKAPGLDGFPLAFWSFSWDQGQKNRFFRPIFRRKIGFQLGWKRFWEVKIGSKKIGEKSPIFPINTDFSQ